MRHVKEDWADAASFRVASSQLRHSRATVAPLGNHTPRTSENRYGLKLDAIVEVSAHAEFPHFTCVITFTLMHNS